MQINWKRAFTSILIGAVVAFITVFLEGLLDVLQNLENNMAAGAVGGFYYSLKSAL